MKATHIVGGELFYENTTESNYLVTLIVYRDCGPDNTLGTSFDEEAKIGVFFEDGSQYTQLQLSLDDAEVSFVPIELENPCFILPPDLCIQRAIYTGVIILPPVIGGYDLVYQRCCRNNSIINLTEAGETGMTMWAHVPGEETTAEGLNSSAQFVNTPPVALCLNGEFFFDHSATDVDGDLLEYQLCTPLHGASPDDPAPDPAPPDFADVIWGAGYSDEIQIPAAPDFVIDPLTGQITGTPTQLGKYAVGICVNEYRNGQLINTTIRDFQYQVTNCDPTIIAAIPDQNQLCDGLSFQFNNESFNASSFLWDFGDPNSTQDTSTQVSPFYSFVEEGLYEVTLIANPGWPCADTATNVYEAFPQLMAEIESISHECVNGVSQYTFIGSDDYDSNFSSTWSFPSAFNSEISSETEVTQSAPTAGIYTISYTIEENGCEVEASSVLEVPPEPLAVFAPQTLFCEGFTFDFENLSQNADSYDWDFGVIGDSDDVSVAFEPSFTYPGAGNYTVTLRVLAENTCPDEVSALYDIQALLDPFFEEPEPQCFNGHSFDFTAEGFDSQSPTISWLFGNDATPSDANTLIVNDVTWESAGIYEVALAISENNCTKVFTQNVQLIDNPIPNFYVQSDEGCPPISIKFYDDSNFNGVLEYFWDFGDGQTSTQGSPSHEYTVPGTYDVSLSVSSNGGCSEDVEVSYNNLITVYPTPTAGFITDEYTVNYLEPTVIFTDTSQGGTDCFYDFGDGSYSIECDPVHDFEDVGFLDVTQTITNEYGCFDIYSAPFIIEGHFFYAPNSFTPNGDFTNDYFLPVVIGVTDYQFRVFNRWGEIIFETTDSDTGWNGSVNNGDHYSPNGLYNYQIIAKDLTGYPHEYSGHISLIR
ncbi:MAG: PKD domain-containing protein [Flavobacteriales bacterium]